MLARQIAPILGSVFLSACSSFASVFTNMPAQYADFDSKNNEVVVMNLTGERRIGVVRKGDSSMKVCAESLPDAAMAAGGRTGGEITVTQPAASRSPSVGGAFDDQYQTALLQTFHRTETADIVRQIGWQLCQAWSNGAIKDQEFNQHLTKLIERSFNVLDKHANAAPAVAPGAVQVNLTPRPASKP